MDEHGQSFWCVNGVKWFSPKKTDFGGYLCQVVEVINRVTVYQSCMGAGIMRTTLCKM